MRQISLQTFPEALARLFNNENINMIRLKWINPDKDTFCLEDIVYVYKSPVSDTMMIHTPTGTIGGSFNEYSPSQEDLFAKDWIIQTEWKLQTRTRPIPRM